MRIGWLARAKKHGRSHARGRGDARHRWDGPRRCRCSGGWRVGPQRVGRGSPAAYTSQGLKSPIDTKQKKGSPIPYPCTWDGGTTEWGEEGAIVLQSTQDADGIGLGFFFVFSFTCDMANETHADWATLATSQVGPVDTARVGGGSGDNQPSVASLSTAHTHTR